MKSNASTCNCNNKKCSKNQKSKMSADGAQINAQITILALRRVRFDTTVFSVCDNDFSKIVGDCLQQEQNNDDDN